MLELCFLLYLVLTWLLPILHLQPGYKPRREKSYDGSLRDHWLVIRSQCFWVLSGYVINLINELIGSSTHIVSELILPYLGDRYTWGSSTFWLKDLLRASGEVMLLYWSSKLWLSFLKFICIVVLGEGIEDILPPKNSWNSGLVVMRIGIALRILDFIVKRVNIFNIQELNMSMEATREHKNLVIDCKSKRSSTKNKKICDTKIMQGLCLEVLKLHQPTEAQHVRQFPKCLHGELFPNFPFSS